MGGDGEEQDAYILGVDVPAESFYSCRDDGQVQHLNLERQETKTL